MKSVIPGNKPMRCFLCGLEPIHTEEHHCMHGTANRRLAEADGLKVNICMSCHRKLHDRGFGDLYLQQVAEETWLHDNPDKGITDWIIRYGKNYLE